MSPTIYLCTESEKDTMTVQALLNARGLKVEVKHRCGGGISNLARLLSDTIDQVRKDMQKNDCIAVLCDADEGNQDQARARHLAKIREICEKKSVPLAVARNAIESWILADSGISDWLELSASQKTDSTGNPKRALESALDRKGLVWHGSKGRQAVLKHLKGDGDARSGSLAEALRHLADAPCVRP